MNLKMAECLNQRNNNEVILLGNQLQLFNFSHTAHTHANTHIHCCQQSDLYTPYLIAVLQVNILSILYIHITKVAITSQTTHSYRLHFPSKHMSSDDCQTQYTNISRTVLCHNEYCIYLLPYAHSYEQFLQLNCGLFVQIRFNLCTCISACVFFI